MTDIKELKALLDEVDTGKGGLAEAMKLAEANVSSAKARVGRLRELGRLLKTTTEKKPRGRRPKVKPAEAQPTNAAFNAANGGLFAESEEPDDEN